MGRCADRQNFPSSFGKCQRCQQSTKPRLKFGNRTAERLASARRGFSSRGPSCDALNRANGPIRIAEWFDAAILLGIFKVAEAGIDSLF